MRLEASGVSRKFYFYKPTDAMSKAGAQPQTLRFEGQISGKSYSGTAFLYTDKCERLAFPVSGQVENHDERVTLKGQAPRMDGNCQEIGKRDQTLVFDFMKDSP